MVKISIRLGGSCGGRYSRPIAGITSYENRILQNNEHKYFWEDCKFCINNSIYLIVNIDTYITGGRWRPQNQELRDFVISVKNQLKKLGATKSNCRFTVDNESDEYCGIFEYYWNMVRVIHDALNSEFELGAGNFRTSRKDWYENLAKLYSQSYYEVFDYHMQDGLNDINDIASFTHWISYLKNTYKLRIAVTEGNNFYNVATEKGHSLLKAQIKYAESIGAEAFCFVYANWGKNNEESDDNMSYCTNFAPVSKYWPDMLNFINSKKPLERLDMEFNYVKKGSKNEETKAIQQIMIDEGYDLSPYGIDGIYGNVTEAAIKKWQTDNNLKVDGTVGKETWQWIVENIATGLKRFNQLIIRKASFR